MDGMGSGGHGDVGAEEHAVADINMGVVHQRKMKVRVHIPAEMHIPSAPVGIQGRLDVAVFPNFGKHLLEQRLPLCLLGRAGVVEIIQPIEAFLLARPSGSRRCRNTASSYAYGHGFHADPSRTSSPRAGARFFPIIAQPGVRFQNFFQSSHSTACSPSGVSSHHSVHTSRANLRSWVTLRIAPP